MKIKRIILVCIIISVFFIFAALTWRSFMKDEKKIDSSEMKEYGVISLGRASIGIFDNYFIIGKSSQYEGMDLKVDNSISEKTFSSWIEQRWNEIKSSDKKNWEEYRPEINKLDNHKVWFKFNAFDIGTVSLPEIVYDGEGGVWFNNKAVFIAPKGAADADIKIPKLINKIREYSDINNKGFCFDIYCIDMPASKRETAHVTADFPYIKGLTLSVFVNTYTHEQNVFHSKRNLIDDSSSYPFSTKTSVAGYQKPTIMEVDGLKGEESFFGYSEKIKNDEYDNLIQARWYYPGTSGNPNDPEIEINLVYETKLDHKPSQNGWFDDETVKQTGFTAEKFLSMWNATLKSFKYPH